MDRFMLRSTTTDILTRLMNRWLKLDLMWTMNETFAYLAFPFKSQHRHEQIHGERLTTDKNWFLPKGGHNMSIRRAITILEVEHFYVYQECLKKVESTYTCLMATELTTDGYKLLTVFHSMPLVLYMILSKPPQALPCLFLDSVIAAKNWVVLSRAVWILSLRVDCRSIRQECEGARFHRPSCP